MENYIFNKETLKIELHFAKAEYDALTDEQRKLLKSNYLWSRSGGCWVSRAKEPHLYGAEQVARNLGFKERETAGERLTFAEQLERKQERAEARAEKYETYADNAVVRAQSLQEPLNRFRGDTSFFTQPNVNTASGRAFTNYRNKLFERHNRGFEEYRKSDYFRARAETAQKTADMAKLNDKGYLMRRVEECRKEIGRLERDIINLENTLYKVEQGETIKNYLGEVLTAGRLKQAISETLERVESVMDKEGFMLNRLDELGGVQYSKENIRPGFIVQIGRYIGEVVSVGSKNIKILTNGFTFKAAYAEITKVLKG